ncbi:unnamed protein product [Pocillopora meandrina]|uniref:Uncharacterized protein n=1 Tax=Pocillopora meandrina TaxID=46732 RepID=A0AAU9W8Q9_9CNID|nr:unnamed protein product [Pocillopora meandrina]
MSITDVETEIVLILGRVSTSFSSELDLSELTICPRHCSSLGIGWRRGSNLCRVPPPISKHGGQAQKNAKAERGLGKSACYLIWKKLGIFIPVGSDSYRETQPLKGYLYQASGISKAHDLLEQETSLYLPSTLLEEIETSTTGMKSEEPIDHLNSFLRSRDVSPIRYTLKTPWNDASGRTRRLHERKAKQAVSAVLGEIAPNDPDLLWESIMSSKQNETGNHKLLQKCKREGFSQADIVHYGG